MTENLCLNYLLLASEIFWLPLQFSVPLSKDIVTCSGAVC